MQKERFEIFKSQDPENGHFDVTFEIEGKKLFANKIFLTSVSETLNAMLSERWTNKDEAIKLETYSFDNFYEFLSFLYTGHCSLNSENVFQLVDMAEFYGVPFLKEYCDEFFSLKKSMKYNVETVEEMFEFSQKYSLNKMEKEIGNFICCNIDRVINSEGFLSSKKAFVDFLYSKCRLQNWDKCFEAVYKWTEHQVIQQKSHEDENFNLLEAVKEEFCASFPQTSERRWEMTSNFLINFVFEKGIFFSPEDFEAYEKYHLPHEYCGSAETCFKHIYEMAEKQALKKHDLNPNENFILADSIKADLVYALPRVRFYDMSEEFLMDYVVAKGIISEDQLPHIRKTRVCIQNGSSRISGIFNDDSKGWDFAFELLHTVTHHESWFKVERRSTKKIAFAKAKFTVPSTPTNVTKMKGIEWYLCLDKNGVLTFNHHTMVDRSDYLLVEMKIQNEFVLTPGETTCLTAQYNNLEPVF